MFVVTAHHDHHTCPVQLIPQLYRAGLEPRLGPQPVSLLLRRQHTAQRFRLQPRDCGTADRVTTPFPRALSRRSARWQLLRLTALVSTAHEGSFCAAAGYRAAGGLHGEQCSNGAGSSLTVSPVRVGSNSTERTSGWSSQPQHRRSGRWRSWWVTGPAQLADVYGLEACLAPRWRGMDLGHVR